MLVKESARIELKNPKVCAVCGDYHATNVRLVWERTKDRKRFNICCACAEADKVNAESVNNYPMGEVK